MITLGYAISGADALVERQKSQLARISANSGDISGPGDARPPVALAAADGGEVDPVQQGLEIGPRQRDGLAPRTEGGREQPLLEPPTRIQQPPGPKPVIFIIVRRRSAKTNRLP
ncbi:MAG: hypothetical protein OXI87_10345 [Albidovulum sp.]|nr:hypothetical protein [Albidovulum sp.]